MAVFKFKKFDVRQDNSALKVGTDAMVLGASAPCQNAESILDIGTGTGILALMMAQINPTATIDAIEIDENSCLDAAFNFQNSPWADRLNLFCDDFFNFDFQKKYDFIISNPPYHIDSMTSQSPTKAVAKHITRSQITDFFGICKKLLNEGGKLQLNYSVESEAVWQHAANKAGFHLERVMFVWSRQYQVSRILVTYGLKKTKLVQQNITIRSNTGSYTKDYVALTKEFHDRHLNGMD